MQCSHISLTLNTGRSSNWLIRYHSTTVTFVQRLVQLLPINMARENIHGPVLTFMLILYGLYLLVSITLLVKPVQIIEAGYITGQMLFLVIS